MAEKILIIEDEKDIAELIAFNLQRKSFDTQIACDGIKGLQQVLDYQPDLIILDLMMPGMDGLSVKEELSHDARTRDIPVIILTARSQTDDKIKGLEAGADDYMTKPFSPKELVLRVQNLLKRSSQGAESGAELHCGPFHIIKSSLLFYVEKEPIDLTSTEFKLIIHLCENVGKPQDRNILLTKVLGYHKDVHSRTLDTHMKRLRKKLGAHTEKLQTVRGIGYMISLEKDD